MTWDDMKRDLEEANETLAEIRNWANAYPETVFTELTNKELDEITEKIGANAMTRLHGTWGRHITEGIRIILSNHDTEKSDG